MLNENMSMSIVNILCLYTCANILMCKCHYVVPLIVSTTHDKKYFETNIEAHTELLIPANIKYSVSGPNMGNHCPRFMCMI